MSERLDDKQVEELARLAGLELSPERRRAVLAQFTGLLADADAVNAFMAARRDVGAGVRFDALESGRGG